MKQGLLLKIMSLFLVSVLLLTACSSQQSSAPNTETPKPGEGQEQTKPPIKLGVLIPKTGKAKDWGEKQEIAYKIAVDEINAAGGINGSMIELSMHDTGGKNEEAVTLTRQLIKEQVAAIAGPYLSGECEVAFPIADKEGVPIISSSSAKPETQRYRLGMSILHLNGILTANLELNDVAKPYLTQLVEKTRETAHLCILDNLEVIYTQQIECNHPVRILSSAGRRNPTYCTSSGKVFLAFNSEDLVHKVIKKGLQTFTPRTITDPEELVASLTKIREEGYALNSEELQEGVVSIAAPIRNHTNEVIAAIGIAAPKQRMDRHKIPGYATILKKAAQEVSRELGYFSRKSYY